MTSLRPLAAIAFLLALLALALPAAANAVDPAVLPGEIERRLRGEQSSILIDGAELAAEPLRQFYRERANQPAWAGETGDAVLSILTRAGEHGLDPASYNVAAIAARRRGTLPEDSAAAELLLTDGLLRYATHVSIGRVRPAEADDDWRIPPPNFDSLGFLRGALGTGRLEEALAGLPPPFPAYARLREGLAHYRQLAAAGGWPGMPTGPSLRPGMEDAERVPALRRRLAATGEYDGADLGGVALDEPLSEALKLFQAAHGLAADGVAGARTVAALNVTAQQRAEQIKVNLERWRWLPRQFEPDHIMVNLAGATLDLVEEGRSALSMKVIIGTPKNRTPAMRGNIRSVVVNPAWNVPYSIALKEILPELKRDPDYLVKHDMRIVGLPADTPEAQGSGIDWQSYSRSFPYRLRQQPGPKNPLGRIKFDISNPDDIYLHDTPSRNLFARDQRAFSHGCVRVEMPMELAIRLLSAKEPWSPERLGGMIEAGGTRTLPIARPVPTYLVYFTAWPAPDGRIRFGEDIYDADRGMRHALSRHALPQVPRTRTAQN